MMKNIFSNYRAALATFFVVMPVLGAGGPKKVGKVEIVLDYERPTFMVTAENAIKYYSDCHYQSGEMVRMVPVKIIQNERLFSSGSLPQQFFSKPPQVLKFKESGVGCVPGKDLEGVFGYSETVVDSFDMPIDINDQVSAKINCEELISEEIEKSIFLRKMQQDIEELKKSFSKELEQLQKKFESRLDKTEGLLAKNQKILQDDINRQTKYSFLELLTPAITSVCICWGIAYAISMKQQGVAITGSFFAMVLGIVYLNVCHKWKR